MATWYFSYGADRIGPLEETQAIAQAQQNPNGHCWKQGFTDWLPIQRVAELNPGASPTPSVAPHPYRATITKLTIRCTAKICSL